MLLNSGLVTGRTNMFFDDIDGATGDAGNTEEVHHDEAAAEVAADDTGASDDAAGSSDEEAQA